MLYSKLDSMLQTEESNAAVLSKQARIIGDKAEVLKMATREAGALQTRAHKARRRPRTKARR